MQGLLFRGQPNLVVDLGAQGRVIARFVYGETAHVPAYMIKVDPESGAEKTYRIVADHLGSPRLVIDVETREIAQRMDYDEFGIVTKDTNPGPQPFGFAGGANLYGYSYGSPQSFVDLFGLHPAFDPVERHIYSHAARGNWGEVQHTFTTLTNVTERELANYARQCASKRKGELIKQFKSEGVGTGARSG